MSHTWRFPAILLLSVVFGAPVLRELALVSGDLPEAGLRYLAALALSWLGVNAIARLMDRYSDHNESLRRAEEAEALAAELIAAAAEERAAKAEERAAKAEERAAKAAAAEAAAAQAAAAAADDAAAVVQPEGATEPAMS